MPQPRIPYTLTLLVLLFIHPLSAQKRWTGGSGNWVDAANWLPAGLPDGTDAVILDNTLQAGNYTVTLPDDAVIVRSLLIAPAEGKQIELHLPSSNGSSPGFTAGSADEGIVIQNGGVFRNSSGLASGQSLLIKGTVRIGNGGTYVHNTRSGHAADVVAKLSVAAGTENGLFEYDVPGGSYPVSLSNRTYGTLVFSSAASGGTQTYNASGSNPLLVRGDMVIKEGVILNLDFTREFTVLGDYRQEGGTFNIGSQPNNNVVAIHGAVWQSASGSITETSTGLPTLEFSGKDQQRISLEGKIANQVALRMNNTGGVLLQHDLTVPYLLQMQQGNLISSWAACLKIPHSSTISGASAASFVHGPIQKTGDEAFMFPVGKQHDYAPVSISAGTSVADEFTAEYFLGNPQVMYGTAFDPASMVRVSSLEYWKLDQPAGHSVRKVTLTVGVYSRATALDKILISRWDDAQAIWKSSGNTAYTGVATGQVTSRTVDQYGVFTLASTVPEQNPLPVTLKDVGIRCDVAACTLYWQTMPEFAGRFEIEQAERGGSFIRLATLLSLPGQQQYQFSLSQNQPSALYRLKLVAANGSIDSSKAVAVPAPPSFAVKQVKRSGSGIELQIVSGERQQLEIRIFSADGKTLYAGRQVVAEGDSYLQIQTPGFRGQLYILWLSDARGRRQVQKFFGKPGW